MVFLNHTFVRVYMVLPIISASKLPTTSSSALSEPNTRCLASFAGITVKKVAFGRALIYCKADLAVWPSSPGRKALCRYTWPYGGCQTLGLFS